MSASRVANDILVDDRRHVAFSIVSCSFEREEKWILFDGSNEINAIVADVDFWDAIDKNAIDFSKNDVLVCETRFVQKFTPDGLSTENTVERVLEIRRSR